MRSTTVSGGKLWIFRGLAVALSISAALVITEVFLRVQEHMRRETETGVTFESSVFHFCAPRHHCLTPNGRFWHGSQEFKYLWSNNALGMRDRERTWRKPADTFRILFMGDSMVQGHGVKFEDTVTAQLEDMLNQAPRVQPVEVLNAGVFGYSPLLEYLYLREIIDRVTPDLVLVGVTLDNDIGEDLFYQARVHVDGNGAVSFNDRDWPWTPVLVLAAGGDGTESAAAAPLASRPAWAAAKDVLRHSRVVGMLKPYATQLSYPRQREREFAVVRKHLGDIRYDLGLVNYAVLSKPERMAYWQLPLEHLREIVELCRGRGVGVGLVIIPPAQRIEGETDFDEPYQLLQQWGATQSVPVINLLPALLQQRHQQLYYRFDRHWTPAGTRVAAAALNQTLRHEAVVPIERRSGQ